jgi:hypothetical protein
MLLPMFSPKSWRISSAHLAKIDTELEKASVNRRGFRVFKTKYPNSFVMTILAVTYL